MMRKKHYGTEKPDLTPKETAQIKPTLRDLLTASMVEAMRVAAINGDWPSVKPGNEPKGLAKKKP